MHIAATEGHLEVVKYLLDKNCSISQSSSGEEEPIVTAAKKGHLDVFKLLLERSVSSDISLDFNKLYNAAIEGGNLALIQYLTEQKIVEPKIEANTKLVWGDFSPLVSAAKKGDIAILHLLPKMHVDEPSNDMYQLTPSTLPLKQAMLKLLSIY